MSKFLAEFAGTFALVFFGCAAIVFGGFGADLPNGVLPIGLAFGITVAAMVYVVGPVSGAHLNPAVTIGAWSAGRLSGPDVVGYVLGQILGAIVGAGVLAMMALSAPSGYDLRVDGLGATTFDPAGAGLLAAIAAEFLATVLFVVVILVVTRRGAALAHAGLVIGLTLMALHLMFVPVSGNSVNPARSLGPALFVGGAALNQLWLYLIVPGLGGLVAGRLMRRLETAFDQTGAG